jgi:hypothetical protein
MRHSSRSNILAASAFLVLAACSDNSAPASAGAGQLSLSLATRAAPGAAIAAAAPDTQAVGPDTLIIDTAQVVLRKIDLERVSDTALACAESDHQGDNNDGHADECEELKAGPLILDLPLTPGTAQGFSIAIDTGTFAGVHFQIHKLTNEGADQALLALHPEFTDISVRVTGTFNGTPFVYTNDVSANQEFRFAQPLAVATAGNVDLTLLVDVNTWFTSGGALIDPATAGKGDANEGTVTHNIRNSFHTFHDENHDCHDDDGNGEHQGGDDSSSVSLVARN